MTALRIALTGARGFVGSHLARSLRAAGHCVVPLGREAPARTDAPIAFSLETGVAPDALAGFDALIHCAHDFSAPDARENRRLNEAGSIRLFDAAGRAGIRNLVFVSTMSAFPGCRSNYGKAKLAVEQQVTALGGVSIRPGFVYDATNRGLSGSLRRLATASPVIPVPGSGNYKLYPVHGEDLGTALVKIVEAGMRPPVVTVAQTNPCTLAGLLRLYARQAGRPLVLLPVPWQPMWAALRVLEACGARPSFRSDSLLSLLNQNPSPDFQPMRDLGLIVRSLE